MPITTCSNCHGVYHWALEEAFDKFGFNDGEGQIMTADVAMALTNAGYDVEHDFWGSHNDVIGSIRTREGRELIPDTTKIGYDDPRDYLPSDIVALLDATFPEGGDA